MDQTGISHGIQADHDQSSSVSAFLAIPDPTKFHKGQETFFTMLVSLNDSHQSIKVPYPVYDPINEPLICRPDSCTLE